MSFFFYEPQNPGPIYYDPEDAFQEYRRREYVKQLQEKAQRVQFERELQLEEERHRAALEAIARKERIRRQQQAQFGIEGQAEIAGSSRYGHPRQQYPEFSQRYGQLPQRPSPQEVLARRLARQREEEQHSRQFHQNILSQIFGIPPEELAYDEEEEYEEEPTQPISAPTTRQPAPVEPPKPKPVRKPSQPTRTPVTIQPPAASYTYALPARQQTQPNRQPTTNVTAESLPATAPEGKVQQPADATTELAEDTMLTDEPPQEIEDTDAHWSAAPERAQALAAISAVDRSFNALKATFVFPSGHLERLPNSDPPRLAYNPTNAIIHAYEHALSDLLSKLDGVESHGFKGVREARKQLVVKIENELGDLDKRVIERLSGESSIAEKIQEELPHSATSLETIPAKEPEDVEMNDEPPKGIQAFATVTAATPSLFREESTRNEPIDYPVITQSPTPARQLSQPAMPSTDAPGAVPKDAMEIATETATKSTKVEASKPDAVEVSQQAKDAPQVTAKISGDTPKDAIVESTLASSAALATALPETASDEEEEIADACLVGLNDDEIDHKEAGKEKEKAHESAVGEFEMV